MKLEAKVAVVTGASKGIGAAIAKHLAAEGASVIVNYASSRDSADRVVAEITAAGGNAVAVQANVANQADIIRLFKETIGAYGKLDILINNAGIYEFLALAEITPEHFYRQYDLNVLGLILTTQEAVKHMSPDGGAIVNMSSVVSTLSPAGSAVYNSTKSAVDGLTRSFAKELAPRHIRVNSINPGLIQTEGFRSSAIAGHGDAVATSTPLGRMGQPQDIAPGVVFLASDDSSWMTGETLHITGGLH